MSGQTNPQALVQSVALGRVAVRQTFLQRAQEDYRFFEGEVRPIRRVVDTVDTLEAFYSKLTRQFSLPMIEDLPLNTLPLNPSPSEGSMLPKNRLHMVDLLNARINEAQASGYDDELYGAYQAIEAMTQSWLYSDSLKERIHNTLQDLHAGRLERQSRYPLLAALHQQNVDLQGEVKRLQGELEVKIVHETKIATEVKATKEQYDQEVKAKSDLEQQNTDLQAALVRKNHELKQALDLHQEEVKAKSALQKQNTDLQLSLEAKNRELEEAKIRHAQELKAQSEIIAKKDKQIDQLMAQLNKAITRLDQAEERIKQFGDLVLEQKEQQKEKRFSLTFFKSNRRYFSSNKQSNRNEKTRDDVLLGRQLDWRMKETSQPPPVSLLHGGKQKVQSSSS